MKKLILFCFLLLSETISFGQNQNSLYFDGMNDKVDLPTTTHAGITTNGTIEAWIKTSFINSGYRGIVVRSGYYGLFLIDNKLSTFVWGGGAQGATTYNNVSLNDGIWHHVALRFQIGVTDGTQMYLDGQPVGPPITLDVTPASNNFQIGCNTNVQFFNGQIDNVKIYSRALSASEINDSYNCLTVNSAGSRGSYNFNQGVAAANNSGITTLSDQSGNNNNGTLLNFSLIGSTSNWVNGKLCCFSSSSITGTTNYCQGETMNLTASFVAIPGESITGYQWKKNGVNLTNGGNISGATSANLQIANLVSSDFSTYSVEVTSTCGVGFNSENVTQPGSINISNLRAYYPLNNSFADASGNNYNATGTATTSVNDRLNQANSAISFNGSSSTVTIAAPAGQVILGNGQNKSISMWFKRSSYASKGMLLSYQQAFPGNWNPLAYIGSDGVLRGWMYQGGTAAWTSGIMVDTNWHHLALVYTTSTQTAYLDGSQVATMSGTPNPGVSNIIYIGNGYANTGIQGISTTGNQPFSGLIDEVRFYNAVLTPAEINTLRTSPFLITTQPQNQSVCVGDAANLSLNVLTPDMGSTFDYQWTFNGTPLSNGGSISGANTNNLQISNAQASNAGTYNCILSPGCNEAMSSSVTLTVGTGNVNITQQPQNTSVCLGSSASLSIVLTGPTVTYQWKKDGINISGATDSTLNLTNVSSSDAGNYTVDIFGGSCGTFSSQVAVLTVLALDSTVTQAGNTLTAVQSGANYTWVDCNNGNQSIAGANGQSYTPSSNGSYAVIVEQNGCSVTSNCLAITVVGLENVQAGQFRVYPSPASTEINVELDKTIAIRLVDVTGKLLLELNGSSIYRIDVTDLTPGMYIIESAEGAKAKFIKK
jgi:hypothetical protein